MASGVKTSNEMPAGPLTGAELVRIVQFGGNAKATTSAMAGIGGPFVEDSVFFPVDPATMDCTAAINDTMAKVVAAGGVFMRHRSPKYRILGTVGHMAPSGLCMVGVGKTTNPGFGTTYSFDNGSADCMVFGSTAAATTGLHIEGFRLEGINKTGGRTIVGQRLAECAFEDLRLANLWDGIDIYGFNNINFRSVTMALGKGTFGVKCWGDDSFQSDLVRFYACAVSQSSAFQSQTGLWIDGACSTIMVFGFSTVRVKIGLRISNDAGASRTSNFGYYYAFESDFPLQEAIRNESGDVQKFYGGYAHGAQTTDSIYVADGRYQNYFTGVKISGAWQNGINMGAVNSSVIDCGVGGNSLAGDGLYDGILLRAACRNINIVSGKSNSINQGANKQGYGVRVEAGAVKTNVVGTDLAPNFTGTIVALNGFGINATSVVIAGGVSSNYLTKITLENNAQVLDGLGEPEGVVAATRGSIYGNNFATGKILWGKITSTGNTGWSAVGLLDVANTWSATQTFTRVSFDTQFYLALAGTTPTINVDPTSYLNYDRPSATWSHVAASVVLTRSNATGFNVVTGSLQINAVPVIGPDRGVIFLPIPAASIAALGNAVNTANKAQGKAVWDSTNGRLMIATGSAAGSTWKDASGAVTVTPV